MEVILQEYYSYSFDELVSSALPMKLVIGEDHGTPSMISQHWFRYWIGSIGQQANVDPNLSLHMASLGYSELKAIKFV